MSPSSSITAGANTFPTSSDDQPRLYRHCCLHSWIAPVYRGASSALADRRSERSSPSMAQDLSRGGHYRPGFDCCLGNLGLLHRAESPVSSLRNNRHRFMAAGTEWSTRSEERRV